VRTDAINFTPKAFANSSPGFALDSGSASDSLVRTKSTIHEVTRNGRLAPAARSLTPAFRDASCDFVDRALTIEQKKLQINHYFTLKPARAGGRSSSSKAVAAP